MGYVGQRQPRFQKRHAVVSTEYTFHQVLAFQALNQCRADEHAAHNETALQILRLVPQAGHQHGLPSEAESGNKFRHQTIGTAESKETTLGRMTSGCPQNQRQQLKSALLAIFSHAER